MREKGRSRRRWNYYVKLDIKELVLEDMDWICMAQDSVNVELL
jgi:hypothetical protein